MSVICAMSIQFRNQPDFHIVSRLVTGSHAFFYSSNGGPIEHQGCCNESADNSRFLDLAPLQPSTRSHQRVQSQVRGDLLYRNRGEDRAQCSLRRADKLTKVYSVQDLSAGIH